MYVFLGTFVRVQLMESGPDADDFLFANGRFDDKSFEMLSYITDERLSHDASLYLDSPGRLPASETQGVRTLDLQGQCFANLPPKPQDYIPRPLLEAELKALILHDQHPIVTLHGGGGTGKTFLL